MFDLELPKDSTCAEIAADVRQRAGSGKRIVFVSGRFNVVHPGHLRLLKFASDCGDYLVVGVVGSTSSPITTIPKEMRLEAVRCISLINYAFLLEEPPEEFIAELKPDVVVKGKEYESRYNPEQRIVGGYGGKLLFSSGEVRFSSMELLRREYFEANLSTITKPLEFPARHGFTVEGLKDQLAKFNGLRVIVIGDLIVDEYIDCDPLGMSQEDPTIVVTPLEKKRFVGGAGIVAAHAQGLGATVKYFTVAGIDEASWFASKMLSGYGVDSIIVPDDSRPTTLKQRFRAGSKTLLRVSHLRQHDIRPDIANSMFEALSSHVTNCDLIIFSDFNYGCLPQGLVNEVVALGRERGITMTADSQASSQISDISRFMGMDLLTPTEREARLALRDWNSGLAVVAEKLREKAATENVVITLGSEGLLVHARNSVGSFDDRLPAMNTAPRDAAGAGDSFLACTSMALCAGIDIWPAAYLGALAAACQVSRVGNTPLAQADLMAEIDHT